MPESKTAEFLAAKDYDHFYQLAHYLSEYVLVRMIDINVKITVLKKLYEIAPAKTLNIDAARIIENAIPHLSEFAQGAVEQARRFFWPRLATEEGFHEVNQHGTRSEWTVGKYIPEESCHHLETLLNKAEFEAMVFANGER